MISAPPTLRMTRSWWRWRQTTLPRRPRCKPRSTTSRAATPDTTSTAMTWTMIGHDPHELAAYLSAVLQGYYADKRPGGAGTYLRGAVPADVDRGSGGALPHRDPDGQRGQQLHGRGSLQLLHLKCDPHQQAHIFRGIGAADAGSAGDVPGVPADAGQQAADFRRRVRRHQRFREFGRCGVCERHPAGNQAVVDIAKSQVGNVGGQPYWSWYGFTSRVEWCACFVSWCYGQMGLSEPRLQPASLRASPGSSRMDNGAGRITPTLPPATPSSSIGTWTAAPTMWASWVGTDGSKVYTVEGNSGDACKIKSYSLTYECIKGYGLMNW